MTDLSTRRALLHGAACLAVAVPAMARAEEPSVWLGMDQKALDDAYTQSVYAPNVAQVMARYAANSEITRQRLGPPRRYTYGPTADEGLDVFSPVVAPGPQGQPISIFVHGGAWRANAARNYAFAAELFAAAAVHHVVLDFVDVDTAHGDLAVMADQVKRAIAWVYDNADSFGGDRTRIHLYGHSSGAHLAAVALTTNWRTEFNMPANAIKTALLCSGIYDLKPVRLSVRSTYVRFTDAMEDQMSPARHLEHFTTPVILAHGTRETPEFQRQTRDFAALLKSLGKPAELLVGAEYNHFELAETLASPYGVLGHAALRQLAMPAPVSVPG